jgi:two-component system chemotaxis response regulator CheB
VEMPRMDGITFLKKIMSERPTPVVICSTLTEKGAKTTMEALASGAVAIVTKPRLGLKQFLADAADDLVATVKAAARANVRRLSLPAADAPPPTVTPKQTADAILAPATRAMTQTTERVVALGTSTGGTQALEEVLTALPGVCPGIVIVQHMPEKFTAAFAARLDSLCRIAVKEAANNDRVVPGRALIAPGGRHMLLKRSGAQYHVEVVDGPLVNRHRPSVDVLLGGQERRPQRAGCHHDRHGRRRCRRPAGDAQRRRHHAGTGRRELRGVRHAQGSRQARRRAAQRGAAGRGARDRGAGGLSS